MILAAVASVSLLISERGNACHVSTSCPTKPQLTEAVRDFERERLNKVQAIWEKSSKGPDEVIIGPHMFVLKRIFNVFCVNETPDSLAATCKFRAHWGKQYRENFIADLKLEEGKWRIVDAKSVVQVLH